MLKHVLILVMMVSIASAQTKGKGKGKVKEKDINDTAGVFVPEEVELSPFEEFELTLPLEQEIDGMSGKMIYHKDIKKKNDSARAVFRKQYKLQQNSFRVYTKRPNPKKPKKGDKMQLCINIVAKDTSLTYCMGDTIIKDPETSKLLYNRMVGDTAYMLIYVEAFTKTGGECSGGKETKVFFVRWNAPLGKAIWKAKTINSCYKTITNMTKVDPLKWDGKTPILFSYNKGDSFIDVTFDPDKPKLGFQTGDAANGNYNSGTGGE
jgi:hypothetical protein